MTAPATSISGPTVPSLPIRDPAVDVLPRSEQWREVARRAIAVPPSSPQYPQAQAYLAQAGRMLHANSVALQQKQAASNGTENIGLSSACAPLDARTVAVQEPSPSAHPPQSVHSHGPQHSASLLLSVRS